MNENLKKYGIPIAIGLILLYLIFRLRSSSGSSSTTSTINRLVPIQSEANTQQINRDNAKVAGFQALAQVAGQQIAGNAQKQALDTQLQGDQLSLEGLKYSLLSGQEVERIKAGLQRELGLQSIQNTELQINGSLEAARINSADRRYDTDAQTAAIGRMYQAQENVASISAKSALDTLLAQLGFSREQLQFAAQQEQQRVNAVQSVGQTYRNQSLERQGTILNALSSIWNQPNVYSYQNAFGGNRPPTFLQQLSGLLSNTGLLSYLPF